MDMDTKAVPVLRIFDYVKRLNFMFDNLKKHE